MGGSYRTRAGIRSGWQVVSPINDLGQPIGPPVDWEPALLPPRTLIEGRFCRIEPLDPDRHAAELHAANLLDDSGRMWTYMPYGPFATSDEYQTWCRQMAVRDDPFFYAVIDADSNRAAGVASYLRIEAASGVIEVGHIAYSPALQQTTAATEAMYLMMSRAFDELGYRRYEWKCDALNDASRQAADRLGFAFEGIFRQATMYKGRNRDTAWYSITDADWARVRAGYEAWLDPSNHDAEGIQRQSLGEVLAS